MSKVTVTESYLEDIGDAIRNKLNTSQGYTPAQMAAAIESIPTGGITPTGTIIITQNGTEDVTQYASAAVNVPNSYAAGDEGKVVNNGALVSQTGTTATQNGTIDTTLNNEVAVNVPNSYSASDEGKVVQSGALVAQTSETVTENGTYDTTTKDEVVVNVSGGAPNLQDKTFTQNGTYTADTGYDGFNEVTVNVSGGGGASVFCECDFTKGDFTDGNVVYNSNGATFGTTNCHMTIPFQRVGMTIEIDVASMDLSSGADRRLIVSTAGYGLIYRSAGVWSFRTSGGWQNTAITDGDFFSGSTVKVHIDSSKWHIYKDGVLVFETNGTVNPGALVVGGSSQSINNAVLTKMRVY